MHRRSRFSLATFLAVLGAAMVWVGVAYAPEGNGERVFSGERAYEHVVTQIEFGPRPTGSAAQTEMIDWLVETLQVAGWDTEIQTLESQGQTVRNVIARRGEGEEWLLLGAHYDTRLIADEDPDPTLRTEPVMGANDGASGVAVLLELARALPTDLDKEIWLVFFDAEDNGRIPGWDWILGSRAFVANLADQPDSVVIVDMVGDADLQLYYERSSDPALSAEIWEVAAGLGYSQFIPEPKHSILDDHTPFLQAGIRAVDIIDFDYPYWHTTADTLDKVSAESLEAVGATVLAWLLAE